MNKTIKQQSLGVGIGIGCASAIAVSIIGAAISVSMIMNETIDISSMGLTANIVQFLSTAIGCLLGCAAVKGKYALVAGGVVLSYVFLLVGIAVLTLDSRFTGFWTSVLSTCLGYVVACAICISLGGKKKNRKKLHG